MYEVHKVVTQEIDRAVYHVVYYSDSHTQVSVFPEGHASLDGLAHIIATHFKMQHEVVGRDRTPTLLSISNDRNLVCSINLQNHKKVTSSPLSPEEFNDLVVKIEMNLKYVEC